ncbi:MAG: hypothetical protein E7365_00835 [Clostridiales bacterium]|nr:hypothetical protein [Clostridiales bacterium]
MLYISILILCLFNPEITINSVKDCINLWANSVVPVLLPFFIISKAIYYSGGINYFSKILNPLTKILGLDKNICFPFAMTLLCGYQTGSKTIALMEKDGLKNVDYYANICFSSSPLFVIGTVGTSILNNTHEGYMLYLIHILSLLIFISIYQNKNNYEEIILSHTKGNITNAINESILGILSVCCYMILFSIIISIISTIHILPLKTTGILSGLLEITTGIKIVSSILNNPLPVISFYLSFGGCCVNMQCINNYNKINVIRFIINRIICGIISFILCYLYKKTAIYLPIAITAVIIIISNILRRKKSYLLKSSKSCDI